MSDPFDLDHFLDAQRGGYATAPGEVRNGRKRSHRMWYVFPQLEGLGFSATSRRYGIRDRAAAQAYRALAAMGAL